MKDIKNLTFEELKSEMNKMGEPDFRAEQIFSWLYQKGASSFHDFSNIPRSLRDKLKEFFFVGELELFSHFRSQDRTEKFLFKLQDGNFIETVLIPSGQRRTVCLSTQVGCKFSCAFCASGLRGFTRNLAPSEMLNQVLYLRQNLDYQLTNLVLMGMGEPLDNYENVAKAILTMNSSQGMGIAARRITVSTCGIIPGLERFKSLGLQVNLSLSLHAVTDKLRNQLMPVNKKYPLEKLLQACQDYLASCGRKMTLEYILFGAVNDSAQDADGLAEIARRLRAKVNLIPYSPVCGLEFRSPSAEKIDRFIKRLEGKRIGVTLRRSKGQDILAACGQLAGRAKE